MLSVIIVNYNVKYFLEQCLLSVQTALEGLPGEIIVVDNASSDGSSEYLTPRFPGVTFLWNAHNVGFARANNQALSMASGEVILFLNPDTIVAEDSFRRCLAFFDEHPDAGALGVHMIDGSGKFLRESKRSFPGLATSFYKLAGLARLFPRSSYFGRYHLGHLDPREDHIVDVLSGAFLMVKKSVLADTGGFDERFFMYGEDIDLSYRIQQAGFQNYYFSGTTIIHYKGESTQTKTLKYVRMFYLAMVQFVDKHYSRPTAGIFSFFLRLAIWLRSVPAGIAALVKGNALLMMDVLIGIFAYAMGALYWSGYVRPEVVFHWDKVAVVFCVAILIQVVVGRYMGLHDKAQRWSRFAGAIGISALLIFFVYALLPDPYRFSRGMMLSGVGLSGLMSWLLRLWAAKKGGIMFDSEERKGSLVVGSIEDYQQLADGVNVLQGIRLLGRVSDEEGDAEKLGSLSDLPLLLQQLPMEFMILCSGLLGYKRTIGMVEEWGGRVRVRIFCRGSKVVVGSEGSGDAGLAMIAGSRYALAGIYARRQKRLLDVLMCLILVVSLPLHLVFIPNSASFCRNLKNVWLGRRSWVGYAVGGKDLPNILPGVLGTHGRAETWDSAGRILQEMDEDYATHYGWWTDVRIITRGYRGLGISR